KPRGAPEGSSGKRVWKPATQQTWKSALPPERPTSTCSAGFQTCRIADFQIGSASKPRERRKVRPASGFGNPRYSRLGSLRYLQSAQLPLVAQVSKPAVSPISKSAARRSLGERRKVRPASGFGNPRYSRLGSLRYVAAFGHTPGSVIPVTSHPVRRCSTASPPGTRRDGRSQD